ncbi:MAG TPA: hypothetical protein VH684_17080 [Xanthobacteraceae bacterium]
MIRQLQAGREAATDSDANLLALGKQFDELHWQYRLVLDATGRAWNDTRTCSRRWTSD